MKKRVIAVIVTAVILVAIAITIAVVFLRRSSIDSGDGLVIIVGSGVTGARAALELSRERRPFLIVEASRAVGGRLRSASLGRNMRVELGANWIHYYGEKHEMERFADNDVKLIGTPTDFENITLVTAGLSMQREKSDAIFARYNTAQRSAYSGIQRTSDMSVADALRRFGNWNAKTASECAVEHFLVDSWFGLSSDRVAASQLEDPTVSEKTQDRFIKDPRGYNAVVHKLLRQAGVQNTTSSGPLLLLDAPVRRIQYSSSGVTVHLRNGTSLPASAVISTVSIGVLKNSYSSNATLIFDPPLSNEKRAALSKLEMGAYTKSYVRLRSAVFSENEPLFLLQTTCDAAVNIQNLNRRDYFPGSNAVLVTTMSSTSRKIDEMDDKQALASALRSISAVAGRKINLSDVSAFVRGRFGEDELFRGAFSGRLVGFSDNDLKVLRKPDGRLFLAGEALDMNDYGTAKSAWDSGRDTARLMV